MGVLIFTSQERDLKASDHFRIVELTNLAGKNILPHFNKDAVAHSSEPKRHQGFVLAP